MKNLSLSTLQKHVHSFFDLIYILHKFHIILQHTHTHTHTHPYTPIYRGTPSLKKKGADTIPTSFQTWGGFAPPYPSSQLFFCKLPKLLLHFACERYA